MSDELNRVPFDGEKIVEFTSRGGDGHTVTVDVADLFAKSGKLGKLNADDMIAMRKAVMPGCGEMAELVDAALSELTSWGVEFSAGPTFDSDITVREPFCLSFLIARVLRVRCAQVAGKPTDDEIAARLYSGPIPRRG